jgi:hypothetical protein
MSQTSTPTNDRRDITSTALEVITNPEHFATQPYAFRTAWQILKQARGQTVDLHRAGPAAHRFDAEPRALDIYRLSQDGLDRLRARAASKSVPIVSTVWPSDGDAA